MKRVFDILLKCISVLLVYTILVIIMISIVFRFLLNSPFMWTEELGSIVLIALIFVGAGLTYYSGEMVRMDFIFIRLPAKVQIVLTFVFDCIITLVSGLLIWPAIQFLKHFANVKTVILQISYAISYAPTLILMLMLAVCGIIRVSRTVLKIRNHTLW